MGKTKESVLSRQEMGVEACEQAFAVAVHRGLEKITAVDLMAILFHTEICIPVGNDRVLETEIVERVNAALITHSVMKRPIPRPIESLREKVA